MGKDQQTKFKKKSVCIIIKTSNKKRMPKVIII
jgi:hypothetical protein